MKSCELCESWARIYCGSDQANLCWTCDYKVHGANFLVARHSRTVLCQACQCLTPWSAVGPKLGPTVSFCNACSGDIIPEHALCEERASHNVAEEIDLDYGLSDDDNAFAHGNDEHEDGENQAVPWRSTSPVPDTCSSISGDVLHVSKRNRECCSSLDLGFQDDLELTSSIEDGNLRPLKERRIEPGSVDRAVMERTGLIKESIERIQQDTAAGQNKSACRVKLCRLSRD